MARARRFVGTIHVFQGPQKSNPTGLYAIRNGEEFVIGPLVDPWKNVVGKGLTINKAAGDFEIKWKARPLPADQYTGPHWEEGIKAEKPAPPPKPPAAVPTAGPAKEATPAGGQPGVSSDSIASASSGS